MRRSPSRASTTWSTRMRTGTTRTMLFSLTPRGFVTNSGTSGSCGATGGRLYRSPTTLLCPTAKRRLTPRAIVLCLPPAVDRADADDAVPHIADLDLPQLAATTADLPECARRDEGKRRRLSGENRCSGGKRRTFPLVRNCLVHVHPRPHRQQACASDHRAVHGDVLRQELAARRE